ncbi:DUF2510 domain-containing protein [Kitasatospora cinereorecta]|uniref:DUF2510 domain-containing protein n=1 Tax=Kitasatospora cinereorecta TaxID=285560 RepID=A0ABW0V9J3_9ACTN
MTEQIPAGWYPDPKDTTSHPRPERWWDGKGWTATTRPAGAADAVPAGEGAAADTEDTAVLEGTVLDDSGTAVRYPEYPALTEPVAPKPARRPSKPVLIAATVSALLGLAVGSGITYLAMDGRSDSASAHQRTGRPGPGQGYGGPGSQDGQGGRGGQNGQNGPGGGLGGLGGGLGGLGGGTGKGRGNGQAPSDQAVDAVNGISLPVPSGWDGGTTTKGYAALSIGAYTCADGKDGCTLGGAVTGRIDGTDAKQAAQSDIAAAAKESYGDIKSHEELKSEAVKVDGRDGYLVRWKVDAPQGNNGYVESVVFPTADGKALVSVHLGFDIADKAPNVDQMDTIVKGITDYQGGPQGSAGGTRT